MSVETLSVVLHHSEARGTAKLVLLGIANHAGDGGAWPAVATLARYANVDERSVQRALTWLEKHGELEIQKQAGGASGVPFWKRTNRYEVLVACPATCDRTPSHRPVDLWINPVTPVSPGDASVTRGVTPVSPHPVTPVSPEPSLRTINEESAVASTSVVQAEERPVDNEPEPRCSVCSRLESDCRRRVATSGHAFLAAVSSTSTHVTSSSNEEVGAR